MAHDAMADGLAHIEAQVKGIEQAIVGNPGLTFDTAKMLIESSFRTVLGDRSVAYAETDDLPKLFKSVTQHLPFLPSTAAAETADTIIGFLHRVHRQDRTSPPTARAFFDDNFAFNESLDEAFGPFRIIEVEFRPSEVLFTLEPETYRIYFADFDGGADSETIASVGGEVQP